MNFAICGVNEQLSDSQKQLRDIFMPHHIKKVKMSEVLKNMIRKKNI